MRDNPQDPQAPMSAGACVPLISDGSLHLMVHILLFTPQTASRYLEHVTQCKHCVRGCCVMLGERCIKGLYVFGIGADFFLECFFRSVGGGTNGSKIVNTVSSKAFECSFVGRGQVRYVPAVTLQIRKCWDEQEACYGVKMSSVRKVSAVAHGHNSELFSYLTVFPNLLSSQWLGSWDSALGRLPT